MGHRFSDRDLLLRALTHPSAIEAKDPGAYYERLEFLGDSVVGFVIAEEVFRRYPDMPEGGMTRIKISAVAGTTLSEVAADLGLGGALIVGDSERGTGGRGLVSALENVYEALVAALYLDAGLPAAREWVLATLGSRISEDAASTPENPKSLLQEITQARGLAPTYRLIAEDGPPHARTFTCAVEMEGIVVGQGSGRTKKDAEAAAASAALERL
ncbi:MAG: ribonuclease III [Coriobacteriia bacterium]|nr:ribonuclease III [Coriobacteriia bacterium]